MFFLASELLAFKHSGAFYTPLLGVSWLFKFLVFFFLHLICSEGEGGLWLVYYLVS